MFYYGKQENDNKFATSYYPNWMKLNGLIKGINVKSG